MSVKSRLRAHPDVAAIHHPDLVAARANVDLSLLADPATDLKKLAASR